MSYASWRVAADHDLPHHAAEPLHAFPQTYALNVHLQAASRRSSYNHNKQLGLLLLMQLVFCTCMSSCGAHDNQPRSCAPNGC